MNLNMDTVNSDMMAAWAKLLETPGKTVAAYPYWFGFAGLEYFSDWAQTMVNDQIDDPTYKRLALSVVRGMMLAGNLNYWDGGPKY